ncbi:MAG TPA: glycoside hydrolase family 43 protein [Opitutaceae bacterium]|nr:glycoside hydrolase family 43 protein [Opitutaceae bacterium]
MSFRLLDPVRFRPAALAGAVLVVVASTQAAEWPLGGALGAHDPTIIREGDTWWCFTTGRGLRVKKSTDGRTWTQAEPLLTEERAWWRKYAPQMKPLDIWAPDIHAFGGRVWCFYTVSEFGRNNSAIGLLSCSSLAAGDWRDDGLVIGSARGVEAYNAIDANLAVDAEGQPWLAFGSWFDGLQIVRLDPATMKPVGPITALARREGGIEAPVIVHAGGYYHLVHSIDKCCDGVASTYKIATGRAREITGPYVDRAGRPLLEGGGTVIEMGGARWKGPGGQDVHRDGERWVLARHAYDAENNGRPALRIADLRWDAEGWPELAPEAFEK